MVGAMKLKSINLIPKEALKRPLVKQFASLYKKNKVFRRFAIIFAGFIILNFIQALFVGISSWNLSRAKQNMQSAKVKLSQLQSQYLQIEKAKSALAKEEAQKKQRLDLLLSTSSQDRGYSAVLANISSLCPQDLWINNLILSEEEIQINGSTLNNQLITQFINNLDESNAFQDSRFTSSEKQVTDSHTLYNFQVTTQPVWERMQNGD